MGGLKSEGLEKRYEIANFLRGQKVDISNLYHLLEAWPAETNVHVDSLRIAVDEFLDSLLPPGKRRSKLKAADFGLFGSMWWPYASFERLCIETFFALWLFAWDDEVDSSEFSELSLSLQGAQAFYATTLERIRTCLELDSKTPCHGIDAAQTATQSSILEHFAPIGHAIVKDYTLDQRQALMQQIDFWIKMCKVEQQVSLCEQLPSVESYQCRRMGSSAALITLALHEYALDVRLPQHVVLHPMMKIVWDQANVIISGYNDIFSLKKEIAQNQVDTLLPLLYVAHDSDLQAAMDDAVEIFRDSVARFDNAATSLLEDVAGDEALRADVARFIDSCRFACTANFNWSLCTGRYNNVMEDSHGRVLLQL